MASDNGILQEQTRNYALDFVRALSMCLVIMCHTGIKLFPAIPALSTLFYVWLLSCNMNFFFMSGALNLKKTFDCSLDYKKYYVNKFLTILLPFGISSIIYTIWDLIADDQYISIKNTIKTIYINFMQTHHEDHMWFMYTFMLLIILAPFLRKLIEQLRSFEWKILAVIAIAYAVLSTYCTALFSIKFQFTTVTWWIIPFLLGYLLMKPIEKKTEYILYIAGAIGLGVLVLLRTLYAGRWDMTSPKDLGFVLFTVALYILMMKHIHITGKIFQRILRFLSKYSFYVYLLHWNVYHRIVKPVIKPLVQDNVWRLVLYTVFTLLISLAFSIVLHYVIIEPLQKLFRLLFKRWLQESGSTDR